MVFLFYNKHLLRALVAITGLATFVAAWRYIDLSTQKLPEYGARDALAIISFMLAGWLVMIIAEVVDHHYLRVFGCLSMLLGAFVSYKWIFITDGPRLITLESGPAGMHNIQLAYWAAVGSALVMLALLVIRLVLDKQNLGRVPAKVVGTDKAVEGEILQSIAKDKADELDPIPVDISPINPKKVEEGQDADSPASIQRELKPIGKLTGIGGVYLGSSFEIGDGETSIGRQGCSITLENDKQVSRSHAKITVDDGGLAQLEDLASTNGVFVNNERITQSGITPGDVIRIGTTMFKVEA